MSDQLFRTLARSSPGQLERVMRSSPGPDLRTLVGYEWRGYNTPRVAELFSIRKFIKVFVEAPSGVAGHNYIATGASLEEPWERRRRDDGVVGRYRVTPADPSRSRYPNAALIDYGAFADQNWLVRSIRDYLVQPDASDPDVMCGKAYFTFGRAALRAGYFILARLQPYRGR